MDGYKYDPIKKKMAELKRLEEHVAHLKGNINRANAFLEELAKGRMIPEYNITIRVPPDDDDDYSSHYGTEVPITPELTRMIVPLVKENISKWQSEIDKCLKSVE